MRTIKSAALKIAILSVVALIALASMTVAGAENVLYP